MGTKEFKAYLASRLTKEEIDKLNSLAGKEVLTKAIASNIKSMEASDVRELLEEFDSIRLCILQLFIADILLERVREDDTE